MNRSGKLYIQMFSIHGLLRSENMEMGRDADTGGQIKYVVELGRQLGEHPEIERVDLFTRLIADRSVSDDYAVPVENVTENFRIVRIQCGGKKYMRKELLWPHLDEYIDKTIKFIKRENAIPDIVHGHYADAGYVAMNLSQFFSIPFIFTGHSLGRSKKEKLLNDGMKEEDVVRKYKIDRRIQVEEDVLHHADLVVTSTNQESRDQYGMYHNRELPRYRVIPPGVDLEKFYPYYHEVVLDKKRSERELIAHVSVVEELNRFFLQPDKPLILALCRPDKRKNISTLIKAFGEDLELQSMANLAVFAGIRKDISDKEENERDVLTEMLLLMDKYDLYGKMAIPKKHDFEYEVPELYRIAAEKKGVFVNPALTEPFGLTLLEASACGLPIVPTNDGGPRDIIENCKNGILINPVDTKQIRSAVKKIITDNDTWKKFSQNGVVNVRRLYTWEAHSESYIKEIRKVLKAYRGMEFSSAVPAVPVGKRLARLGFFLVTDIDNTLTGGDVSELNELLDILREYKDCMGFAVATGRTIDSTVEHFRDNDIPIPDIIVSSVGSEIYYGQEMIYDQGWARHISDKWNRERIVELLDQFDFLKYQDEDTQRKFKVSYFMEPEKDRLPKIHDILLKNRCGYNLIYSHGQFLDILPNRASKGKAIRYISYKWELPLENIMVCGDSGNDEEMLRGEPLGVVVGNFSSEMEVLRGQRNVYFSERTYAGGIIEGLGYYQFLEKARGV
ncbi:MAG TPA: HAD-IIB family hydrolase [Spirochaetota bacterium]|nr:HAD-IIB family hydrolase [Spirochaetota bacterium]HPQ52735.1 HAD-IIB family hydrolase [Spirochaetota bacterium]